MGDVTTGLSSLVAGNLINPWDVDVVEVVPEPGTLGVLGLMMLGGASLTRRRRNN